jgi:16S rRNA (uracil1498-N3)-methyltransferase
MKIHRFILPGAELPQTANIVFTISDKDCVHQIKNVLKLKPGERIIICDGRGGEAAGEICESGRGTVSVRTLGYSRSLNEAKRGVELYCALLKKENFEMVVQKATEIGAIKIIPLITDRTIKLNINLSRLKKIAKEAAELSGRAVIPEITNPIKFEQAIREAVDNQINIFFTPGGSAVSAEMLSGINLIGVFIGPEGGWSEQERYLAETGNLYIGSLGKTTLRGETAALVAVYAMINL